ncbi:cohesin domain-containing protein [Paenibacillus sp. LjRoot56]|uniref:golvesin C-terminal-like domain-containing protein n=1 Tax=Paenibacillus sp. LjRoot56 TaxID=3342333 RepID=UPI003ECCC8B0
MLKKMTRVRESRVVKKVLALVMIATLLVSIVPIGMTAVYAATGDVLGAEEIGVILDDQDPGVTYTGLAAPPSVANFIQGASGTYQSRFTYANLNKAAPQSMTFAPQFPQDGMYAFYVRKPATTRWYAGNVPYKITHAAGEHVINNPSSGNGTDAWVPYGVYPFRSGQTYPIIAGGAGYQYFPPVAPAANGTIPIAIDGIKFVKVGELPDQAGLDAIQLERNAEMSASMNQWAIDLEKAKYELTGTIAGSTTVGANVYEQVLRLKTGSTSNPNVQITAISPVDGTYLKVVNGNLILKAKNMTTSDVNENAVIQLSLGNASANVNLAVTIAPSPVIVGGDDGNFTDTPTWYRDYAPGLFNPNEGTIELRLRLDKPYEEFGNYWDFLFKLIPEQSGPGNTLIQAHIPPPTDKPTGPNAVYEQPITFHVKNGEGINGAFAYAQANQLNYQVGQPFNLAFSWKMGTGGYVAIYKDGVAISPPSPTTVAAVMEKFMPYEFMVERGNPFNVSQVKISTKALSSGELEHTAQTFSRGTDTALLADITYGQDIQSQKFITPWHNTSKYSVVKPAFRNEKQVYYAGEDAVYPVMTVNYGDSAKTFDVSIKATDPYGKVEFTESYPNVQVAAGGTYHIENLALPMLKDKVGFWYLETTVSSSGSAPIVYKSGISKVPADESGVADGKYANYYGQHANYDYDMSAWTKIHTSATRTWEAALQFLWNVVEPTKGHFVWDKSDAYVEKAQEAGMDVLAVLGYPSDWASTRPSEQDIPAGLDDLMYRAERWVPKDIKYTNGIPGTGEDWRNYVYQSMKRYAGKVKYWEVINEVNFHPTSNPNTLAASFSGTKEEYILMQKIAYEQAQRVKSEYKLATGNDLELYVTTSGFATPNPAADRQLAVDMLKGDNVNYYDIYNVHGYVGTQGIADILTAYTQAKATHPNLQLWQSEVYATNSTVTPWRIFDTVWNYMDFLAAGTSKYFNMGTPAEDTFVTRHSQSPTEMYQTMATLQHHIRKVDEYIGSYNGFEGANFLKANHYLKRTDGKYLSVLSADNLSLYVTVANAEQIVSAQDAYGNPVPVTDYEETKRLLKKNSLFIVSQAPLQITKVAGDVPLALVKNGDFERVSGDPQGGPSAVVLPNWTMGWNRGVYGTNAYVTKTSPFAGQNAAEFNSAGAPSNRTFMYQQVSITQPGTYVLSAQIKKLEGTDVQPELNIWDGTQDHQLAPVTLTNQYVNYSQTYEVTGPINLVLNVGILSGVGKVVFDNISFELVPENVTITMDNSDPTGVTLLGQWESRPNADANKGNFALNTTKDGASSVSYKPAILIDGMYDVYVWQHITTGTQNAPFTIHHAKGSDTVLVNQSQNGKSWYKIGSYPFHKGESGSVVVTNAYTQGNFILADGVRFTRTGPIPIPNQNLNNKLTGPATVDGGQNFKVTYSLDSVTDSVYALDTTVTYDSTKLDFISAASLKDGFNIVSTRTSVADQVRIIASSLGVATAIQADSDVLELTFKPKTSGSNGGVDLHAASTAVIGAGLESTLASFKFTVNVQYANKTNLTAAIVAAEALYNASVEGTLIGQYPAGSKATLQSAINAAKAVEADNSVSQAQIDAATSLLVGAVDAFKLTVNKQKPEDLNGDNRISVSDLYPILIHYGKTSASADWSTARQYDVNQDLKIDYLDMAAVAMKIE